MNDMDIMNKIQSFFVNIAEDLKSLLLPTNATPLSYIDDIS